jgi:NADPH-dependent 2,4-dienoyl-CoA reductase/sulfur reductase-like enzyme/rhodanese-related sulfurtransferase
MNYDELIISTGASPIVPNIEGIHSPKIFTIRSLADADKLKNYINKNNCKSATIVGAGYIGIEMAENLHELGLKVSVIDNSPQIINAVDFELAKIALNHLNEMGINFYLEKSVIGFSEKNDKIITKLDNQTILESDIVILSIGVKPETTLAKLANLTLGKLGGIEVNEYLQTSQKNIWALGDVIEVNNILNVKSLIPLAGIANKQARILAGNLMGDKKRFNLSIASSILKAGKLTIATVGLNEKYLQKNNISYLKSIVQAFSHSSYYPNAKNLTLKILFNKDGKILGAQGIGYDGVDKRLSIIATLVKMNGTIFDLIEAELPYAPPFGSSKDPVNVLAMAAENILNQIVLPIFPQEMADKINNDDYIILDARSQNDFNSSALSPNTINIPLDKLRYSFDKLPKNKNIIVYCNKGFTSYLASRILLQNGFKAFSLHGGFSLYKEFIKPLVLHR